MKKIKVLTDQCIGCGACVGIDPEHFDFNEDGLSHVISEENLESEALKDAIDSCPVGIISLEENTEEFNSENSLEENELEGESDESKPEDAVDEEI